MGVRLDLEAHRVISPELYISSMSGSKLIICAIGAPWTRVNGLLERKVGSNKLSIGGLRSALYTLSVGIFYLLNNTESLQIIASC